MTDERLAHLREVTPQLWPAPLVSSLGRTGRSRGTERVAELLVLPSARRPRLLAPTGRRAAAAVVRHHGEGRGRSGRLATAALAAGLRAGAGQLLFRERLVVHGPVTDSPSLLDHLSAVLDRELVMGMHLGPARANRKPVLQLLDPRGGTVAYAKLGVDPLTDALVRREAQALGTLAGTLHLGVVEVPQLLHAGPWHGHELMVQAALPVWKARRPLSENRLVAAVAEIAATDRRDGVPVTASPFWADVTARVATLPAGGPAERIARLTGRLAATAGDTAVPTGASHGDWAPWNMACLADRLLVWDWERFRTHVPVGADLLHHVLQRDLVVRREDPAAAAVRLVDGAPRILAPLGADRRTAVTTASLYLADLAARYLADRQAEAGAALGDVDTYLLPALDRGIGHLEGDNR